MKVFTVRSSGIGIATGVLAVVVFGQLMGVGWGLAVLNGLALGVAVLLIACAGRLGLIRLESRDPAKRRWGTQQGVWMLTQLLLAPALYVQFSIELAPASAAALTSLFFATFTGAYVGGMVSATLEHRDRDGDGSTEPMRPSASERSDSARGGTGAARE